jgi:hypothetical protein
MLSSLHAVLLEQYQPFLQYLEEARQNVKDASDALSGE